MASIRKVGEKWRVQIRRTGAKSISKMCATKAEATRWAREQETLMDRGVRTEKVTDTVADFVRTYRELREESGRPVSDKSSEHYTLNCLVDLLGKKVAQKLGIDDIVEFARTRRDEGAGPYTVNMDISKLGTVMRYVGSVKNMALPDAVGAARPALHHFDLIGGGGYRERRPTEDELFRIKEWLSKQTNSKIKMAMPDIIDLAAIIALRRGEMFKIKWVDFDKDRRTLLVRDRKDPRKKIGNDQVVPLIGESLEILLRQSKLEERIFPYSPGTISKYFKEACDELSIPDLHWHDLRHESASVLGDAGWTPHEIRAVTGHRSTKHLDRYVNMDPAKVARKPIHRPRKIETGDGES